MVSHNTFSGALQSSFICSQELVKFGQSTLGCLYLSSCCSSHGERQAPIWNFRGAKQEWCIERQTPNELGDHNRCQQHHTQHWFTHPRSWDLSSCNPCSQPHKLINLSPVSSWYLDLQLIKFQLQLQLQDSHSWAHSRCHCNKEGSWHQGGSSRIKCWK